MAYPKVTINNTTDYDAVGEVHYLSWFCTDDKYSANQHTTWTGPDRGVCLVTEISAFISKLGVWAESYQSSGTSFSQFAIIQTVLQPPAFRVVRLTVGAEDVKPADYVEPTEKQK